MTSNKQLFPGGRFSSTYQEGLIEIEMLNSHTVSYVAMLHLFCRNVTVGVSHYLCDSIRPRIMS